MAMISNEARRRPGRRVFEQRGDQLAAVDKRSTRFRIRTVDKDRPAAASTPGMGVICSEEACRDGDRRSGIGVVCGDGRCFSAPCAHAARR
jgi:hypothetical protein